MSAAPHDPRPVFQAGKSSKARGEMAYKSHSHPNLNSGGMCNWIIFTFSFLCDLNFSDDCALNFIRNKLRTYLHFAERIIKEIIDLFLSQ